MQVAEALGCAPAPNVTRTVRGQVARMHNISRSLLVLTLRHAESCKSDLSSTTSESTLRLQVAIKTSALVSAESVSSAKRLIKLGDMCEVVGELQQFEGGVELALHSWRVLERWALNCRGQAFVPDQPAPPSKARPSALPAGDPPSSGTLCKFWANNTGKCARMELGCCPHYHGEDGALNWQEARKLWQLQQRDRNKASIVASDEHGPSGAQAKSERARVFAVWLVGTFGHEYLSRGSGVVDVAGGRGELTFELAVTQRVPATLLDPRHPGKLTKQQKALLLASGPGLTPRRARAVLTLQGPALLTSAELDGVSLPATATATASASASTTAPRHSAEAERAARVGWQDLDLDQGEGEGEALLAELIATSAALVALHPDQATEPTVRCAIAARRSWAVVPCCVFAADNPHRFVPGPGGNKPVATHADLCEYLQAIGNAAARHEGEAVKCAQLDFVGRNTVLYQHFDFDLAL